MTGRASELMSGNKRGLAEAGDGSDFSLMLGGPLYQIFCRAHLCGHFLELMKRRVLVLCGIAWIPLLVLSALNGTAWGGTVTLPLLLDIEAYSRFMLAMPLLIIAELVIHNRMRPVVRQFLESDLISRGARQSFDAAIASALRLRNSVPAEILLISIVYLVDILIVWRGHIAVDAGSWLGMIINGELQPSPAGWWFRCVSLPLLQFLLIRWYYRLFIWTRFLWQVSRLQLNLVPIHPDRSGGIGFLAGISYALTPLLFAQGTLVAGVLADRILYTGAKLPQFKPEIVVLAAVSVLIVVLPLLVFAPRLARLKRVALLEYGAFAQRYAHAFEQKWLRGGAEPDESLLGTGDIQSLADLGNSFEVVRQIRAIPFTLRALVRLVIAGLIPLAPLLLTMVSAEELMQRLLKFVF